MKILKKIFLITLIILFFMLSKTYATTGIVKSNGIRIRENSNTNSKILTNLYEEDKVEIIDETGEWYKIKYKDYIGYVKKEFIKISENNSNSNTTNNTVSSNEIVNDKTETSVYSNNEFINNSKIVIKENTTLKILPNFSSKNIQNLNPGSSFEIKSELNNWVQVSDGVVVGWVLKNKTTLPSATTQINTSDIEKNEEPENNTNTIVENQTNVLDKENESNIKNNTIENSVKNEEKKEEPNNNSDSTEIKKGKINVETARVREKASSSSKIVDFLEYNDIVNIESEEGDWYKITSGTLSGYINKNLITRISNNNVSSRSLNEERKLEKDNELTEKKEENEYVSNEEIKDTSNLDKILDVNFGDQVVQYAKNYLGYPYVVGGKLPSTGFDCSGFTKYVYSNFGINLACVAADQVKSGREISRQDLITGDLILFYNEGKTKIGHVGIYIGNGDFIHSANPKRGVVVDNLNTNSYYNERFVTARRIVE